MKAVGEADLLQDLQDSRMDGIAAEVAVKRRVRFEQGNRNAPAGKEQSQYDPARPAPDYATGGLCDIEDFLGMCLLMVCRCVNCHE
jgi:hypothetical protein